MKGLNFKKWFLLFKIVNFEREKGFEREREEEIRRRKKGNSKNLEEIFKIITFAEEDYPYSLWE